jgi:hypothetical protein
MVLTFSEEDAQGVVMSHDDALVVTLMVANHGIHRILVDNGGSIDILYWPAFQQMGIDRQSRVSASRIWWRSGVPYRDHSLTSNSRSSVQTIHYNGGLLGNRSTLCLQCDYRSPRVKQVESYDLDLSSHDEVSNRRMCGRGERRSGCSTKVLQHVDEEGLESDHSHGGLNIRDQKGTSRAIGRGCSQRRESPANRDLPLTRDSRRPHGFPPQELEVFASSHEDMPVIGPKEIVYVLNVDPSIRPVK